MDWNFKFKIICEYKFSLIIQILQKKQGEIIAKENLCKIFGLIL